MGAWKYSAACPHPVSTGAWWGMHTSHPRIAPRQTACLTTLPLGSVPKYFKDWIATEALRLVRGDAAEPAAFFGSRVAVQVCARHPEVDEWFAGHAPGINPVDWIAWFGCAMRW